MNDRPDKLSVLELLQMNGNNVTITECELIEDMDGSPAGVLVNDTDGTLHLDLDALGWTKAELLDPTVKE